MTSKKRYVFSFYGIIDFIAILPTYLALVFAGTKYLIIIRILRLLRVFRVLKLVQFMGASDLLSQSLRASKYKIIVFLEVVIMLVVIMGTLMYLIEGPANGFDSIPRSIYWAIVTLTTVGYGDISPQTFSGQTLASVIMIIGYAIIAVPTGILSAEMTRHQISEEEYCSKCGNTTMMMMLFIAKSAERESERRIPGSRNRAVYRSEGISIPLIVRYISRA
jgi:voltage-gated potassium channel